MAAIGTDGGGFTIIELTGDDVDVGDVFRWKDETGLGGEDYFNVTQQKVMHVIVQDFVGKHLPDWF